MDITFEFACTDDCLDQMVPSDLRTLVRERDEAIEDVKELRKQNELFLKRLKDCSVALEKPEEYTQYLGELKRQLNEEFNSSLS